ncbi:MAG: aspartyl protease family protein [Terriglobia bacterium]
MRIRILVGLLCTFVTLAVASPLAATESSLPFVSHKGFSIVVHGSIGGIQGLNFIIDTGAVPSVVDSRLNRRLGLAEQPDRVSVFARTVPAKRVVLPWVDVGPIHAVGVEALAQDLSFIERMLGVRVDALIGLDVLGKRNFSIDYAGGRLRFDPPPDAPRVWSNMAVGFSFAVVEIELDGVTTRLMVDTGVKHFILFESKVPGLFASNRIQKVKASSNIGGIAELKQIEPPMAILGEFHVAVESVFLVETPADLSLAFDGLLGVAALKPARVDFDSERRAIGWKW